MSTDNIKPINPRQTFDIYDDGHLTQVQHKNTHIDVVDHFDHGENPVPYHFVTRIDSDGNIEHDAD